MSLYQKLRDLNQCLYSDIKRKQNNNPLLYPEKLEELMKNQSQQLNEKCEELLSIAYYNITRQTNQPKYLKKAIKYSKNTLHIFHWNLQLTALVSSCGNNKEAHQQSVTLIQKLSKYLKNLTLQGKQELLRKQIVQVLSKAQNNECHSPLGLEQKIKQYGNVQKFATDCHLINKKFHIADIMTIHSINPSKFNNQKQSDLQADNSSKEKISQFYETLVYLSVACFTRATQRYYCYEHDEKEYHLKSIKIASHIYSEKSIYLRFLKRTFLEHYKKGLFKIEEVEEEADNRRKIEIDPPQISMMDLCWEED